MVYFFYSRYMDICLCCLDFREQKFNLNFFLSYAWSEIRPQSLMSLTAVEKWWEFPYSLNEVITMKVEVKLTLGWCEYLLYLMGFVTQQELVTQQNRHEHRSKELSLVMSSPSVRLALDKSSCSGSRGRFCPPKYWTLLPTLSSFSVDVWPFQPRRNVLYFSHFKSTQWCSSLLTQRVLGFLCL